MDKPPLIILGISLGTRSMGIAVFRNDSLLEWGVKTFKSRWSGMKLRTIVSLLDKVIKEHQASVLAIKIPRMSTRSTALLQLIKTIKVLADRRHLQAYSFDIEELERYCSQESHVNKTMITGFVLNKHPVLFFEYNKEQKNKNSYYIKIFEAIVAAKLCIRERDL